MASVSVQKALSKRYLQTLIWRQKQISWYFFQAKNSISLELKKKKKDYSCLNKFQNNIIIHRNKIYNIQYLITIESQSYQVSYTETNLHIFTNKLSKLDYFNFGSTKIDSRDRYAREISEVAHWPSPFFHVYDPSPMKAAVTIPYGPHSNFLELH